MKTIRQKLLDQQKAAVNQISTGQKSQPLPLIIYKEFKDEEGKTFTLKDYVSYDPKEDTYKIYCNGRSIEFKGEELDWIFEYLRQIGTEIPRHTISFYDGETLIAQEQVWCGTPIRKFPEMLKTDFRVFETWCVNEELTEVLPDDMPFFSDFKLYARWILI